MLCGLIGHRQSGIPFLLMTGKDLLLSSLLGGVATELALGLGLHGALGSADGRGTGDGGLQEVGAVSGLASGGGNVLVGLAVVGAEGALVGVLRGLAGGLGLGDKLDALLTIGRDADGLLVNVTGVLAGVHVGQVERVTGEVNTTSRVALDQVGVVVAGDLPDEIGGDVGQRHLDGDLVKKSVWS